MLAKGTTVTVAGSTFPRGRLGTVTHSDEHGAIIDVHGIGTLYVQRKQYPREAAGWCLYIGPYTVTPRR